MNDDFWNLGNEETTPDADDMVSESGHESTDTSLPVKHEVTAQDRAEVSSTVSDFSDLKMVLSDLPQDVVDNMPTIQNRINAYLTYFSAMNLARLPKLMQFINAAEELMFNPKDLLHMDYDQMSSIYKSAKYSASEVLETSRKVTQTIQQESDKKTDVLYNMLTSLSPDTVSRLLEMVEAEQKVEKQKAAQIDIPDDGGSCG